MKSKITSIVALDLIFLFLIIVSGSIGNATVSDAVYYLAFLIPIFSGLFLIKKDRDALKDAEELRRVGLGISKRNAAAAIPFIFPTIALICLISYLTSLIMGLFGYGNGTVIEEGIFLAMIVHALIPAALEEMLFRYIPLNLMAENPKCAVMTSSILFAFSHANIFQIPYAAVAGLAFALIDIGCESVVPSFIIHLLNNVISLLIIFDIGTVPILISLGALAAASLIIIAVKRRKYTSFFEPLGKDGGKAEYPGATVMFTALTLFIAVTNLILG